MAYRAYLKSDKGLSGSTKVPGYEQWVTLIGKIPTVIENQVNSPRAAQRSGGEPDFNSLVVQALLGKEAVLAFLRVGDGQCLGKTQLDKVQSDGKNAESSHSTMVTDSYVRFASISFKSNREGSQDFLGIGAVCTYEIVGTSQQYTYKDVGQNQQQAGADVAAVSRLHDAAK